MKKKVLKYSLPSKHYQFSSEVQRIKQECKNIPDYWKQVELLERFREVIKIEQMKFVEKCYNILTTDFHKKLEKWYKGRFNEKIRTMHTKGTISKPPYKFINPSAIQLSFFFNLFRDFIYSPKGNKYILREIESKYFKKNIVPISVNINEYQKLEEYYGFFNTTRKDLEKIGALITIKLSFYEYKNQKDKYDFSNCIYDHEDEEDNINGTLEFSSYLESISEKIIYLKYTLNYYSDEDDLIKIEIEKLENILKYDNTGQASVLRVVEKDNKQKDIKIIQSEKITWLKDFKDLVYLFEKLESLGYVEYNSQKNKLLSLHFNILKDNNVKGVTNLDVKDIRGKLKNPDYPLEGSESIKDLMKEF